MKTITEAIKVALTKATIMDEIGVQFVPPGFGSVSGSHWKAHLNISGDIKRIHGDCGFSDGELQAICDELNAAYRKIFTERSIKCLKEINDLSTPL